MSLKDKKKDSTSKLLQHFFMKRKREKDLQDNSEHQNNINRPQENSLRRSLRKIHSQMKYCMVSQKTAAPSMITTTETTHQCQSQSTPGTTTTTTDRQEQNLTEDIYVESTSSSVLTSALPPAPSTPPPLQPKKRHRLPYDEILSLSTKYWYWGPVTTAQVEEWMRDTPDGTFLVRDSSSTNYLFTLSFRSVGRTMHTRIEYDRGVYNLNRLSTVADGGFLTVSELIEDAIEKSKRYVYCYSKSEGCLNLPVRLTNPISRYTQVRSLKFLCRLVIRQCANINDIPALPLPKALHAYLQETSYFLEQHSLKTHSRNL